MFVRLASATGFVASTLVLAALLAVPLAAQEGENGAQAPDVLLARAKTSMAEGDAESAAGALTLFLENHAASELAPEALYLRAAARLQAKDPAGAFPDLDRLAKDHAASPWAARGEFLAARAYIETERSDRAAEILLGRAQAKSSEGTLRELAGRFVALAEEALAVDPESGKTADFERALAWFQAADKVLAPLGPDARIRDGIASALESLGRWEEARAAWERIEDDLPEPGLLPRALHHRAKALLALGNAGAARELLRRVAEGHAASDEAPLALYELGLSYKPLETGDAKDVHRAALAWDRLAERFPTHEKAPPALLAAGQALARLGEQEEAIRRFSRLVESYPDHELAPEALFLSGESKLALARFDEARETWEAFLSRYPTHGRWPEAQARLREALFAKGGHAYEKKEYDRAEEAWSAFLAEYPEDARNPGVLFALAEARERTEDWQGAMERHQALSGRYPAHELGRRARLSVARILAEKRNDLSGAIEIYRSLVAAQPGTAEANEAAAALAAFEKHELAVRTPRTFTAAEGARVEISTRNVEKLSFKAYRVDLAELFARYHSLAGADGVVTEIVEPDWTWEAAVEGFEKYRLVTRELVLEKLAGPGGYLVEVASEEGRAKAFVVVSDLVLVTKHSPRQLLAWVWDRAVDRPAEGVEVRLSDGEKIVATGRTDADGIWTAELEKPIASPRVLAVRGSHVAATEARIDTADAPGYEPQGIFYTDRPLYRPGAEVLYRGIFRKVVSGAHAPAAGAAIEVRAIDPNGIALYRKRLETSAAGTLAGSFVLDDETPIGDYRIETEFEGKTISGSFRVEAYVRPEFTVSLMPSATTFFTGDGVKVDVSASYLFGGPVAHARIEVQVFKTLYEFDASRYDDLAWFFEATDEAARARREILESYARDGTQRVHYDSLVLDAAGKGSFEFSTADDGADSRYLVYCEARDLTTRSVAQAISALSSTQGFHAIVKPDRKACQAGETLRVEVLTVSADHKPLAREGKLLVRLVTRTDKGPRYDTVREEAASTDETGRAKIAFSIEKGGSYELLYAGSDERGNPIRASAVVEVAGDRESPAARIVAEKRAYHPGEDARFLVTSPVAGVPALVTVEAQGVLEHRILRLESGSIYVTDWTISQKHGPNAFLAVTILGSDRIYEDADEILVLPDLSISVTPDKEAYAPGEKATLAVETRDSSGNAVPAEVSIAVVDGAIFQLAPDATPSLRAHFYNKRRAKQVSAVTSLAFSHEARTTGVIEELAGELERRKREVELARARWMRIDSREPGDEQPRMRGLGLADEPFPDAPALEADSNEEEFRVTGAGGGRFGGKAMLRQQGALFLDGAVDDLKNQGIDVERLAEVRLSHRFTPDIDDFPGSDIRLALDLPPNLPIRRLFLDTAYWSPAVATGDSGRTEISFELPDNLTTWRITARGVSGANLAGESRTDLTVTKNVVLRLETPRVLTEGDSVKARAVAHDRTGKGGGCSIGFSANAKNAELQTAEARMVEFGADGIASVEFPIGKTAPGTILVTANAAAEGGQDSLEREIPVLPYGRRVVAGGTGTIASPATFEARLPETTVKASARLLIAIQPSRDEELLDGLAYLREFPYGCIEQTVSRFVPAVAAAAALEAQGLSGTRLREEFTPIAEVGIRRLYHLQNADGGWGWWGGKPSDPLMTGYALSGLERCRRIGLVVEDVPLARGRAAAAGLLKDAGPTAKALLLAALSMGAGAEPIHYDALFRVREDLPTSAVALLSLAYHARGEAHQAGVLASILQSRAGHTGGMVYWERTPEGGWMDGEIESTALATLALATVARDGGTVASAAEWLKSKRSGFHWQSTKTTALVVDALAASALAGEPSAGDFTLRVKVNGKEVGALVFKDGRPAEGERWLSIDPAILAPGANRVEMEKNGPGVVRYVWRLVYFAAGADLEPQGNLLRVERSYRKVPRPVFASEEADQTKQGEAWGKIQRRANQPAAPYQVGAEHALGLPPAGPGYRVLRESARPKEDETALAESAEVGERIRVRLAIAARERADYVQIEDPLPAGCEATEFGRSGTFDRFEIRDDRVAIFVSRLEPGTHVFEYELECVQEGSYLVRPAFVSPMYEPEVFGSSAGGAFQVLAPWSEEGRASVRTPDEIYRDAILAYDERRYEAARTLLADLAKLPLADEYAERVAHLSIGSALALGETRDAVRAYERLVELNPRRKLLERGELLPVALAYSEMGEDRQAALLATGDLDRSFELARGFADALWSLDRKADAQDALSAFLLSYPDTPATEAAWFGHADRFRQEEDGLPSAYRAFLSLEALFPRGGWSEASALARLEIAEALGAHEQGLADARSFVSRFPESRQLDRVLAALAGHAYEAKEYEAALDAAKTLLERDFVGPDGGDPRPSGYRSHARLVRAKVHHARGETKEAVPAYREVAGEFPEAADAVSFFEEKVLTLEPVTTASEGTSPRIAGRAKNLSAVEFKVYRVDLMVLFLLRRGLGGLTEIDLTGIEPDSRGEMKVDPPAEYAFRDIEVPIEGKEKGVYLVVAGGAGESAAVRASAVVVVSDLDLDVQNREGRVTVHARWRSSGKPAEGVFVRLAAGGELLGKGTTDARGTLSLPAGSGPVSVVAVADGHPAFWTQK
ncbi:MAG: tetratricopeptide repeat protein [Planctomycetes bacterium]|nr:tetratricopeptide repeat protein [Planctomycetota bacterium]